MFQKYIFLFDILAKYEISVFSMQNALNFADVETKFVSFSQKSKKLLAKEITKPKTTWINYVGKLPEI